MSDAGITTLVSGCRRLEVLELANAKRIGKSAFTAIMDMLARENATSDKFALRKIDLVGYPFAVRGYPFRIEDF